MIASSGKTLLDDAAVDVLTPRLYVDILANGYYPAWHDTAHHIIKGRIK